MAALFFWSRVAAFFGGLLGKLNPFKAAGKVGGLAKKGVGAVVGVGKKGVRAVGRGFKKVGRVFKKRRAGFRRFKRVFRRPKIRRPRIRIRRPRFSRCFAPETPIQLENGKTAMIKNLKLGDTLINGSVVEAVMRIKNYNDPYYKIGDIHVTGSHYVKYGTKYVQVKNLPTAERTEKIDDVVSCLVTNDHKIPVGKEMFWDWEDNLIPIKINRSKKICESKVECGQYGC
tara:strand:- start:10 stop:696 length:687 start_codon:yes stop_codon:yes gene_type:complete